MVLPCAFWDASVALAGMYPIHCLRGTSVGIFPQGSAYVLAQLS